jgi:hypothetical protein
MNEAGGSVRFFCTDKDRHQRTYPRVTFMVTHVAFKCGRCTRNVQLRHDRLIEVIPQLHAAGVDEVDTSALPF